jgi:DNA polymerase V
VSAVPIISLGDWYPLEVMTERLFTQLNLVPILGKRVTCGLFGISDDYIEKYQSLDTRFIKNKASTYFFQAASNSMEPLIFEKDVLVVDRSVDAGHKKIVVASINGEMICKRYIKKENKIFLRSENTLYPDLEVTEEMDLLIFGVVIAIARELV